MRCPSWTHHHRRQAKYSDFTRGCKADRELAVRQRREFQLRSNFDKLQALPSAYLADDSKSAGRPDLRPRGGRDAAPPSLLACLNARISAWMGDKSSEAGRRGRGATGIVG